jgi:hypothetical protein
VVACRGARGAGWGGTKRISWRSWVTSLRWCDPELDGEQEHGGHECGIKNKTFRATLNENVFWWIESVLVTGTNHTSSNIISRDTGLSSAETDYLPDGKAFLPRGQLNRVIVSVTPGSQTRVAFYVYITEVEANTSQALLCITTDNLANYKFISKTVSWHVQGEHPHTGPRN